jgi:MOSC domain-containing protein YiiM
MTNDAVSGRVEAIWLKPVRRGPMKPVTAATLVTNRGIVGNANQNGRRQVTIISQERWQAVEQRLGTPVDPSTRRANLMISGIDLENSRGMHLRVGACLIDIWGETRPCQLMDEQKPGLQDALRPEWGGGVFGVILAGGEIRVGDPVQLIRTTRPVVVRNE